MDEDPLTNIIQPIFTFEGFQFTVKVIHLGKRKNHKNIKIIKLIYTQVQKTCFDLLVFRWHLLIIKQNKVNT